MSTVDKSWHSCLKSEDCSLCSNPNQTKWAWQRFNRISCICLKERPDRLLRATQECHKQGLCQQLEFYRPTKPNKDTVKQLGFERVAAFGSWESHRLLAIEALKQNAFTKEDGKLGCILIFEDDFEFVKSFNAEKLKDLQAQIERLPADWDLFNLGYFALPIPGTNRPLSILNDWSVWRTNATMIHAYVLSEHGARKLAYTPYHPYLSLFLGISDEIEEHFLDDWMRHHLKSYATLPMVAVQADSPSDQPIFGKEWGIALHNRIVQHMPYFMEVVTMIIPFITLILLLLASTYFVLKRLRFSYGSPIHINQSVVIE